MTGQVHQHASRPRHEVADVIRSYGGGFLSRHKVAPQVVKVLGRLAICRTSELGGHVDVCPECGEIRISYNSCRDRHCPKCQGKERELWIEKRREEIIPTVYYHCVFTIPHQLNAVAMSNMREFYSAMFIAAWDTLAMFFRNHWHNLKKARFPHLKGAMTALLHTWGSNLSYHPHIHCIVPGGGVDKDGVWHDLPKSGDNGTKAFLFPVRAMSVMFRAKLIAELDRRGVDIPADIRNAVIHMPWNVNTRPTVKGAEKVIEYLGRYAYRVAISNNRIKDISDGNVTFDYKDYRTLDSNGAPVHKLMTITADEFLRRFSWHILPPGLVRIRHYGLLAPGNRDRLRKVQLQLNSAVIVPDRRVRLTYAVLCERRGRQLNECPNCHCEMQLLDSFPRPRSPTTMLSSATLHILH